MELETTEAPERNTVDNYPFSLQKLKKQHGDKLFLVEVEPEDEGGEPLTFVFKMADRKIMSAATKVAQTDPFGSADVLVKNTLVWASNDKALDDIRVFSAVSGQVERIHEPRTAKLKNL